MIQNIVYAPLILRRKESVIFYVLWVLFKSYCFSVKNIDILINTFLSKTVTKNFKLELITYRVHQVLHDE